MGQRRRAARTGAYRSRRTMFPLFRGVSTECCRWRCNTDVCNIRAWRSSPTSYRRQRGRPVLTGCLIRIPSAVGGRMMCELRKEICRKFLKDIMSIKKLVVMKP